MNYQELRAAINAAIKENESGDITATALNEILQSIVSTLGDGYRLAGIATPETVPGEPDNVVYYIAYEAGDYVNFSEALTLDGKAIHLLVIQDGRWEDIELPISTSAAFVEGEGHNSAQQNGTGASALGENSVAENNATSFPYHIGQEDEREIEVEEPTRASGLAAHAEGIGSEASGQGAHAEGSIAVTNDSKWGETGEQTLIKTEASGRGSHAEGLGTKSKGSGSHSEGIGTVVDANSAHGEGYYTEVLSGEGAHIEGMMGKTDGNASHAEGYKTRTKGTAAHAEGRGGSAISYGAHVEGGYLSQSSAELILEKYYQEGEDPDELHYKVLSGSPVQSSACDGAYITNIEEVEEETIVITLSVALYEGTEEDGKTFIFSNLAKGTSSHSEGAVTAALGNAAHAEGLKTRALGPSSHSEGEETIAGEDCAHAEGWGGQSSGVASHTEGVYTQSLARGSHAEGVNVRALNVAAHAEGINVLESKLTSSSNAKIYKATNKNNLRVGDRIAWPEKYSNVRITAIYSSEYIQLSSTIGTGTIDVTFFHQSHPIINGNALGIAAHAEGINTLASGHGSHAEGRGTQALEDYESAEGMYNYPIPDLIKSIGVGVAIDRRNAIAVMKDGRIFIKGVGGYYGTSVNDKKPLDQVIDGLETELSNIQSIGVVTRDMSFAQIAEIVADYPLSVLIQEEAETYIYQRRVNNPSFSELFFYRIEGSTIHQLKINSNNSQWFSFSYSLQATSERDETITFNSTGYAASQAVYEFVKALADANGLTMPE